MALVKALAPATTSPLMPHVDFDLSAAPGDLQKHFGRLVKVFNGTIKSDMDKCDYRYLTLENGLQALLISEPGLDKVSELLHKVVLICQLSRQVQH